MKVNPVLSIFVVFGWAVAAHADPLTDLRTTLGALHASDPLQAQIDVTRSSHNAGDAPGKSTARATVSVRADAQGLQLSFAPKLLEQATREAAAKAVNPDLPSPIDSVLEEVTPTRINDLVDFAPSLLRGIEGATLKDSRAEPFDGKPAQLIVLDLLMRVSSKDRDALKHHEGSMTIWLDANGMPLAAERSQRYEGRKFLISFSTERRVSSRFQRVGARLVAVAQTEQQTFKGFGQDNDTTVVTRVNIQQGHSD